MSKKVTIREVDGTEYQLKAKLGRMIVGAGYARNEERGLILMIAVSLAYALRIITINESSDHGKLRPEGPPHCTLAPYPATDQRTRPERFGARQNWDEFPLELQ